MSERYFAEEIISAPFLALQRGFAQAAPRQFAYLLAASLRLHGFLRTPTEPTYAVGEVESEREVTRDALPPQALSRWEMFIAWLAQLGFSPLRYSIPDVIGEKQQASALLLDSQGSTIATLNWIRGRGEEGIYEKTPLAMNSFADNDPAVMTASFANDDFVVPDFVDVLTLSSYLQPQEMYERHSARLRRRRFCRMTPEVAVEVHRAHAKRRFQWAVKKRLLRPLADTEVARLRKMPLE